MAAEKRASALNCAKEPAYMAYDLSKFTWTESDFDQMNWHDARVHGVAFLSDTWELALDIDYIFEWVEEREPTPHFVFWVAPCTIVFTNVIDLQLDLAPYEQLTIVDISRADSGVPRNTTYIDKPIDWAWKVNCHDGTITFRSAGYNQYVRMPPVLGRQSIPLQARGGVSFGRGSEQDVLKR